LYVFRSFRGGAPIQNKERREYAMSKKTRNIIIALAVLLVLVGGLYAVWNAYKPQAEVGGKSIVLEVVHGDESTKEFKIQTESENLRGALEQEGLIDGTESEYGLYVLTVDGETADEAAQEWWCFTKDGEMLMTGVDDTMIADGEQYEVKLAVGW
jgi:hypothetical protein